MVKQNSLTQYFQWLLDEVKEKGALTERTIIYCHTVKQSSTLYSLFVQELGDGIFVNECKDPRERFVEMLHALSSKSNKEVVLSEMNKDDGLIRVLICTIAFGMGVNYKGVRRVIHFGPSKSLSVANCLLKLKQINRIKHLLDRKTLLLVMNSFVFSKLLYCSTVWSNTSNSNIAKLQKVQNFAGRIILGLRKYDHISDGLRSLNWLPIKERLILNDATMMHKCINKLVPDYLVDMFKLRSHVHNRQTRSSSALDIPLCHLSTGQRSFAYRGAKLWNSLNSNIKGELNLILRKNSVKA